VGARVRWRHVACSAAALLFREADCTLARLGLAMYGHWPSRETRLSWSMDSRHGDLKLEPSLTRKSVVGQIQIVKQGETVGYGRTWRALRPTRLAVVPVGYADGYPRVLGNRARVLIGGSAVPVVGRVCMNILMADVTDVPQAAVGDDVVLLGRQGDAEVSAESLAAAADTINYEILARLPAHIPRVVVS
jgi:alanine racemase